MSPSGVPTESKTIIDSNVELRVLAQARSGHAYVWLTVKTLSPTWVYALNHTGLDIGGKLFRPIDADKRIKSAQRDDAVRKTVTAIRGAQSTSDVEIQDRNGRPVGTATITTRNEAETQRQLDQIDRETAFAVDSYNRLLRDYETVPGVASSGMIEFEAKIKKSTAATFLIKIGDTFYVLPFNLAQHR